MKKQILSFTALLLALLLAGCAASAPQSGSAASASASASGAQPESAAPAGADAQAVTFNDTLGRTVTVESPKRVAALIGSFADVWCLAGGRDSLVAWQAGRTRLLRRRTTPGHSLSWACPKRW